MTKTSRPGHHSSSVVVTAFPSNALRCPLEALSAYTAMTESLRPASSGLFITNSRPYRTAKKDTLARWAKITLRAAGIDITQFSAHSTRAASTTAARLRGVEVSEIMQTAQWTKASTSHSHYYRPPIPSALVTAVLNVWL